MSMIPCLAAAGLSFVFAAQDRAAAPVAPVAVEATLAAGLDWLVAHQAPNGSWDSDGFAARCPADSVPCDGVGDPIQDGGATGLALLALLRGGGHEPGTDRAAAIALGLDWLLSQQDEETGLIGTRVGHAFMYRHGIATLALCEGYRIRRDESLREPAQRAVDFIAKSRNPYSAWRYDSPPTGDNDTSVTGWMVCALDSARQGGLDVDPAALVGALGWFDEVTDPESGRVGYDTVGSLSSRIVGMNDRFPVESGEAMTAEALRCRLLLGQHPARTPILVKHLELMQRRLPEWDETGSTNDFYYWYHGTKAMRQIGDERWSKPWFKAMYQTALVSQASEGHARGSWDPKDPWGFVGGRVFSTSLMCLCLAG